MTNKPVIFYLFSLYILIAGCATSSDNREGYERNYHYPSTLEQIQVVNLSVTEKMKEYKHADSAAEKDRLRQEIKDLYQEREELHEQWQTPGVW